jgi:hypothetical protein
MTECSNQDINKNNFKIFYSQRKDVPQQDDGENYAKRNFIICSLERGPFSLVRIIEELLE